MNVVFTSIYARACMGAGLAVFSGVRAFLPVAFLALYSRLEFASAPILDGTPFAFLEKTWVISLFLTLAVVELAIDKMPALDPNPRSGHAAHQDRPRRRGVRGRHGPQRLDRHDRVRHPGTG